MLNIGKEGKNALWLIFGRIIQMLISFFVNILSARYLGPNNYGLVNYGLAYVSFFTSLCTLGLNSVIIRNFVEFPEEEGQAIGTALLLRIISSILSVIMIWCIVSVVDKNEPLTKSVVLLSSISLIFHVFETFNFWFQSKYKSKVTSIATLLAYTLVATYKIILLILSKNILWFAVANSIDYILIALFLYLAYKKSKGPRLCFSKYKAKQLLEKSWHYILSGMMIAVYGQTDKLMLKHMLNEAEVGYYATATSLSLCWVFVLSAIIDSMYPTIIAYHKKSKEAFNEKNKQLYSIVIYLSFFVSIFISIFGYQGILFLYGENFLGAVTPLSIVTWYTALSYLGVARNAWIVCENKQRYLKYMYFNAALLNVLLNYILIPKYAASGAAIASLVTQLSTSIILPFFIKEMRPNCKLMLQAINPKILISFVKKFNN